MMKYKNLISLNYNFLLFFCTILFNYLIEVRALIVLEVYHKYL
jgi:hypothetical protein